jgi:hypothetical protein
MSRKRKGQLQRRQTRLFYDLKRDHDAKVIANNLSNGLGAKAPKAKSVIGGKEAKYLGGNRVLPEANLNRYILRKSDVSRLNWSAGTGSKKRGKRKSDVTDLDLYKERLVVTGGKRGENMIRTGTTPKKKPIFVPVGTPGIFPKDGGK